MRKVLLVWADEEGGRKAVEAPLLGHPGGLEEPELVAFDTPVLDVIRHRPDEGPQAVVVPLDQGQLDGLGVLPQAVPPGPVLGKGMDIGIVPVPRYLIVVSTQNVDTLIGTGSTADMQQGLHKRLRVCIWNTIA